jgi:hypothetical protein
MDLKDTVCCAGTGVLWHRIWIVRGIFLSRNERGFCKVQGISSVAEKLTVFKKDSTP